MKMKLLKALTTTVAATIIVLAGSSAVPIATAAEPDFHPEDDRAGSTIAAHSDITDNPNDGSAAPQMDAATSVQGLDVSGHQGNVNWASVYAKGGRFAYVKATEGTTFRNPYFAQQYNGSYKAKLIRGAYHFALPNRSSATSQANFFVGHGGGWSADGKTLPPMLDIEYNPYGSSCYGLSRSAMVSWIRTFSNRVHTLTKRYPTIYTTTNWWKTCTGNNAGFGKTNPLFIARYSSKAGTLPAGWKFYTFWQYADHGKFPGDQDVFNGSSSRLQALAKG
jgi:GH25 family lysozyme M1 (1,4-beta-N-acetylmuramidase)